ncbi:MAG: MG2 domain-containing protein [Tepidisphaerales bacterium]
MLRHDDHVVDYVDDYLHDLLEADDARYVRRHCDFCPICGLAMEQARQRLALVQSGPPSEPSQELIARTVARVKDRVEWGSRMRKIAWRSFAGAMVAAVLIIGMCHLYYLNLSPTPYDLRVVAQSEMLSDTEASLRAVLVRDAGATPVAGAKVNIDLLDPGTKNVVHLASFTTDRLGTGQPRFRLPAWQDGKYELRITATPSGTTEHITRSIKLQRSWKVMLSTDKPVYQPGQTIHVRALALRRPDLKPVVGQETVFSLVDPKGNVLFKHRSPTSKFGITSADCELADEILEGAYEIRCTIGDVESKSTVEVKRYVLPKFNIALDLDQPYYQPGQRMNLTVRSAYFFGKPVADAAVEATLRGASGDQAGAGPFWRLPAAETYTVKTDARGQARLALMVPAQLLGREQDSGDARVWLEVLVRDTAGQEQRRTISRVVTGKPLRIEVIPESGQLVQGVPNTVYLLTTYADGRPAKARVAISGLDHELQTSDLGAASFELTPKVAQMDLTARAVDAQGISATTQVSLKCGETQSTFAVRTDKAVYTGGQTMKLTILGGGSEPVFVDLIKDGQTLLTQTVEVAKGRGECQIDLPPEVSGTLQLSAYRIGEAGLPVHKTRVLFVQPAQQLKLDVAKDKQEYRPGDEAELRFTLRDAKGLATPGAISLAAVDEAVFSVLEQATGMERLFFALEQELLKPIYTIYGWSPDFSSTASPREKDELEQTLFSRASQAPRETKLTRRQLMERAAQILGEDVRDASLGPDGADDDRPVDAAELGQMLRDTSLDAEQRQMILAGGTGYGIVAASHPEQERRISLRRHWGVDVAETAWGVLGVIVGVVLVGWILFSVRIPLLTCLLMLFLLGLLVSIMLPSLNASKERANRVKVASNLRQIGEVLELTHAPPGFGGDPTKSLSPRIRQWFPETLLWRPELITDERGEASLPVSLADSITTWRLSASAVAADGRLGGLQSSIRVFQPFFVDINLPVALTRGDEIAIPVVVYNYLDRPQSVELTLDNAGNGFELLDVPNKRIDLVPGDVKATSYRLRFGKVGRQQIQITARGNSVADAIRRDVEVLPDGRRIERVVNGSLSQPAQLDLSLPADAIEGSARLIVKIHPSTFSQVVEGLDGIFQMPYGCFEQTSSTTYPNIMALSYLRRTGKTVPAVEAKAKQYINLGYQRLVGFEVSGGGFDWFGQSPANVLLTAYGLMEFQDMADVHDVDSKLIDRTRAWLMSRRSANGSWPADAHMIHDGLSDSVLRGADPNLATTAYVAWAVFGTNPDTTDAVPTLAYLRGQQPASIADPYIVAVLANALLAMDPTGRDAAPALNRLQQLKQSSPDGKLVWWDQPANSRTAFCSAGRSSSVETTALATLAMVQSKLDPATVRSALAWLIEQKDANGTWQSTHATVLALKALLAGTGKPLGADAARRIQVTLGDVAAKDIVIPADQAEVMQQLDLSSQLRPGANRLALRDVTDSASGYQVTFRYHVPGSDPNPAQQPLAIDLTYDKTDIEVGQTMTARLTITNRMTQTAPMVMLDLPIPAGFAVETDDLQKLVSSGVAARYQLTPRTVIVYLRSLRPDAPLQAAYRLKATMPVQITVPPARVYEYYDPQRQGTSAPQALKARPAA